MISFAEAIALNLAMDPDAGEDPDFILTVAGENIGEYCQRWKFVDAEEGMSQIACTLANPDKILTDTFEYGQEMEIRFGYRGNLGEKAHFEIAEIVPKFPQSAERTIDLVARDETQKMGGGHGRGNLGKGKDGDILYKALESDGIKLDSQGQGTQHDRSYVMNENSNQLLHKYGSGIDPGEGSSGGNQPTNPLGNEKGGEDVEGTKAKKNQGLTFSSAERLAKKKGQDGNRGKNQANQHGSKPVTAKLKLKGFPTLRAKATVEMLDFGEKYSGTYYVDKAIHSWELGRGYYTEADLSRGGVGKGGVGGKAPMVFYADIWKKGSAYLGPRKIDGEPQATFRDQEGKHLVDFEVHVKPQSQRHGGEPKKAKGKGLDLYNKLEAFETGTESKSAGNDAAGAQGQR